MYQLTNRDRPNQTVQLRITMEDNNGVKKVVYYDQFYLEDSVRGHGLGLIMWSLVLVSKLVTTT
jgi:hypothetical protein